MFITAPYGIFARSCVAMAKDSKSTFQIIDDEGCPVDPSIFPGFSPDGNALQSIYEAFRFTESYGVIFQCNVKYCLGPCDPVSTCTRNHYYLQALLVTYRHYLLMYCMYRPYVIGAETLLNPGAEGRDP